LKVKGPLKLNQHFIHVNFLAYTVVHIVVSSLYSRLLLFPLYGMAWKVHNCCSWTTFFFLLHKLCIKLLSRTVETQLSNKIVEQKTFIFNLFRQEYNFFMRKSIVKTLESAVICVLRQLSTLSYSSEGNSGVSSF